MLGQEEFAFMKAISIGDFSPAIFKKLRNALAARGKEKKPMMPA
jgi:hypothetical protein